LKRLEGILHPAVRQTTRDFLDLQTRAGQSLVVLDIPLLYETGGEALCDAVVVVTAPSFVQHSRVMARRGMTAARFQAILDKQMPDREKRRRADFVIDTGLSKANSLRQLRAAITLLREHPERYRRRRAN
jgi:dephospho-CoA kinase